MEIFEDQPENEGGGGVEAAIVVNKTRKAETRFAVWLLWRINTF